MASLTERILATASLSLSIEMVLFWIPIFVKAIYSSIDYLDGTMNISIPAANIVATDSFLCIIYNEVGRY